MRYLCILLLLMLPACMEAGADLDTFVGIESIDTYDGIESIDEAVGIGIAASGCTWQTAWDATIGTSMGTSGERNFRNRLDADTSSYSGSKVRVTVSAGAGSWDIAGLSIGLMTTDDDFDVAPTRITFDTGNNGVSVGAGTSKLSDEIDFTFTKTSRYGIHVYTLDKHNMKYSTTGSFGVYYTTASGDGTLTQSVSYTNENNSTYGIDLLEVCSP